MARVVEAAAAAAAERERESDYQSLDDPGYQDFRAEATIHYRLRAENLRKAQEAYHRGLGHVASWYSQQVTESLRQMKTIRALSSMRHCLRCLFHLKCGRRMKC